MINQVSCKLTHSLLLYAEKQGAALSQIVELFEGPEEFLRDPHFWIDLNLCEKLFVRAARILGDPTIGSSAAAHIVELGALGALDEVFKMMPSQKDYYNNLARFFSYFLAPIGEFRETEHNETHVKFVFPIDSSEYRHISSYLRGVLENLPRYRGHSPATSRWNEATNEVYVSWESTQSSLFSEEPAQVLNPKRVQTLSSQLEATDRALQAKSREVLSLRAELDQTRLELQTQLREKIYAEKMSGLAQLAAGVAHEINNPLSYVVSNLGRFDEYFLRLKRYIESLENDSASSLEIKKSLDIDFIFAETPALLKEASVGLQRVKEIVRDLSSLAHPQSGRQENKTLSDLNGILDSTLKVFQDDLKNIKLDKQYELKTSVKVFPVRMSQVFMNLLVNAIQAIPHKGIIEVKTKEKDGNAVIEFVDTGIGMDERVLNRIFTPFFTTKEVGKGTGLGLSIAQSIVEMHKGHIDVKSEKGRGSRFTVTLPL